MLFWGEDVSVDVNVRGFIPKRTLANKKKLYVCYKIV